TEYLLLHESGESVKLSGTGSGLDSGDKAHGKATTYALKYTLLYTFLTPTGKIDDADATHSEEHPAPIETKATVEAKIAAAKTKADLTKIKPLITKFGLSALATEKAGGLK